MRAWNQPWKKSRNRLETRERIELSAGPGNETGRDRDSWPSEAGILVLVSDRPRSRPYKKPRHAANATATAPTARYNTITRNRPLFRPSHGCSIRPTPDDRAIERRGRLAPKASSKKQQRENRWPIGQKSCTKNQFCKTAPATSLSELEHDRRRFRRPSATASTPEGKREGPTGFVHVRLLGILTFSPFFFRPPPRHSFIRRGHFSDIFPGTPM